MARLDFVHVDVFTDGQFSGNSLPVFLDAPDLSAAQMLRITQELRHFETIFLRPTTRTRTLRARIFDLVDELPFAGHPLIGAAAALQHANAPGGDGRWVFDLSGRLVEVAVTSQDGVYTGVVDQGPVTFFGVVKDREKVAQAFALTEDALHSDLPIEVGSAGLRYLVVPIGTGRIGTARISCDISALLNSFGAEFAVLFDPAGPEIRHWNNDGIVEDIATGSAAGVVGAFALKHGLARIGEPFDLHQGRFVGRPSRISVRPSRSGDGVSMTVGGGVAIIGEGRLYAPPSLGLS